MMYEQLHFTRVLNATRTWVLTQSDPFPRWKAEAEVGKAMSHDDRDSRFQGQVDRALDKLSQGGEGLLFREMKHGPGRSKKIIYTPRETWITKLAERETAAEAAAAVRDEWRAINAELRKWGFETGTKADQPPDLDQDAWRGIIAAMEGN